MVRSGAQRASCAVATTLLWLATALSAEDAPPLWPQPPRVLFYGDELTAGFHGRDKAVRNNPRCVVADSSSRSSICRGRAEVDPAGDFLAEMLQASSSPRLRSAEVLSYGMLGWTARAMLERADEPAQDLGNVRRALPSIRRTVGLGRLLEWDDEAAGRCHNCRARPRARGWFDVVVLWTGGHDLLEGPSWASRHHGREGPMRENRTTDELAGTIWSIVELVQRRGNCSTVIAVSLAGT